jgi:membrane-bound metal-dependent hydrolase YbcI (DUF457 family)
MLPWGHAAVGYVCYSLWSRFGKGRAVTNKEFWFLLFATQLPDLVDKTLGWSLDVLPSGRSLAHSLFTTVLLVFIVSLIGRRADVADLATAFNLGYVSHILTDALTVVIRRDTEFLVFLFWPIIQTPYDPGSRTVFGELTQALQHGLFTPRTGIFLLLVFLLWTADGWPGLPANISDFW